jgi:hypothetical protein
MTQLFTLPLYGFKVLRYKHPRLAALLLAAPPICAGIFIYQFASPLPLTDDWFFLRAVMRIGGVNLLTTERLSRLAEEGTYRIYNHIVVVPLVVYWPISVITNFDARALMGVTFACRALQLLLFRIALIRSSIACIPIALILFCPSHYMDFMWGTPFAAELAITFSLAGLFVLDRIRVGEPWAIQVVASPLLISAGAFSSAGGFFGFPAALVLLWLKRISRQQKTAASAAIIGSAAAVYFAAFSADPAPVLSIAKTPLILTAIGAALLGSPQGITEFAVNELSLIGALLVAVLISVVLIGTRGKNLGTLELPLSICTFGVLMIGTAVMSRSYLGNWHLQNVLPLVCGTYAACYCLWSKHPSTRTLVAYGTVTAIALLSTAGYYVGFRYYGPSYRAYVRQIELYALTYLNNPDQPKPFPGTGGWDLDSEMISFLRERRNPFFR